MKKLNNKGMTIIEVLVCFVLVAIITTSMYNSISNFNDRRNLESMKEKIINVKNLFTKQVEDDIVKKGLVYASAPQDLSGTKIITATGLSNGSCDINSKVGSCVANGSGKSITLSFKDGTKKELIAMRDINGINYIIAYGTPGKADYIYEQLPNVGRTNGVLALQVGDIRMSNDGGAVLTVDIRFDHPQLNQKYGIKIVALANMDSYDR
jgi:hypothetical protein